MKFNVSAAASVTLWAEIEADTAEQAMEIAGNMTVPKAYAQAYAPGDNETVWTCDPELGEPSAIELQP